jgi:hypothetical protein
MKKRGKLRPGDRVRFTAEAPFRLPKWRPNLGTIVEAGEWREQRGADSLGKARFFNLVRIRIDGEPQGTSSIYNTDYVERLEP